MHPILIPLELFGIDFSLHTYGAMIALGFVVGVYLASREARRTGVDPNDLLDLVFWVALAGFAGARLLFIVVNADQYWYACTDPARFNQLFAPEVPLDGPRCFEVLKVWTGGLVWYGGFLGALGAGLWFCRRRGLSFLRMADVVMPSVALGHAFGRVGCLAAGCCFGRPAQDLPWAVRFPAGSMPYSFQVKEGLIDRWAESSLAVHPTQLYEAVGELAIFFLLIALRRRKVFHGQVLLAYLVLYPILRSVGEVFRGDAERGFLVPGLLSTSQFISLLVVLGAVLLWVLRLRSAARGAGAAGVPALAPGVGTAPAVRGAGEAGGGGDTAAPPSTGGSGTGGGKEDEGP